ncbi:MAG: radical SAM family heme chaperone HemW [bacterium]|nr:radical SAM family heme chaperone HemW [bacterium]
MIERQGVEPLGLYLHVPFCTSKCGYCDFYSVPLTDRPTLPLIDAIVRELATRRSETDLPITSIFIGGGTPTVLLPPELAKLMEPVGEIVRQDRPAEFTVEANPGTLDPARMSVLVHSGVDRISLGAQSFDSSELAVLERIHSPGDVGRAVGECRAQGIAQINIDLIFGIPGQTLAGWRTNLRRAVDLGVEHIACYGLTYEPGTQLTCRRDLGEVVPCDDGLEAEMYLAAMDDLGAAGYEQYEISNFARPGAKCLHNLRYWWGCTYLGVGPSAAGHLEGVRYRNVPDIAAYVARIRQGSDAVVEAERLTRAVLVGETAMLRLRLNEGLRFDDFVKHTGVDARSAFRESIGQHQANGWLRLAEWGIALTRRGRLMADAVVRDFLAEAQTVVLADGADSPVTE